MYIYSLNNKTTPKIPFYIGITSDPNQRFKSHYYKWKHHKPYINNQEEFFLKILFNTGNNKYSKILAQKIEINLIKYYDTVNHGSNKVYDSEKMIKTMWNEENYEKTYNKLFNKKMDIKRKKTRKYKQDKKFKKLIKLIEEDPCSWTIEKILEKTDYTSEMQLNNYLKKEKGISFKQWFEEFKNKWIEKYKEKNKIENDNFTILYNTM